MVDIYIYVASDVTHSTQLEDVDIIKYPLIQLLFFSFFLAQQIHFVVAVSRAICAV